MRLARFLMPVVPVALFVGVLVAQPPNEVDAVRQKQKEVKGAAAKDTDPPKGSTAEEKEKPKAEKGAADMTFADGSTLRIFLVAEKVELETKYGKLSIPAADVQRIEFAFRVSDDVAKKI